MAKIGVLGACAFPQSELFAQGLTLAGSVRDTGSGAETWVLLSGTMGGIGGMRRIETRLLARDARVITIDVYRLSVDSADVTMAAMARRVNAIMGSLQVDHAYVVGHSHGGGVALRLAASFPQRVATLALIDVGALPSNRTALFGGAMKLAPVVSRMPGGRRLIRTMLVHGIRDNSGDARWFDHQAEVAYIQPLLDNIGRVAALVIRMAGAEEPEPMGSLIQRIHVPVTVVLGQSPHKSAPSAEQVAELASLGCQLHIVRLAGVGHFVHEEAPDQVMRAITMALASIPQEREHDVAERATVTDVKRCHFSNGVPL